MNTFSMLIVYLYNLLAETPIQIFWLLLIRVSFYYWVVRVDSCAFKSFSQKQVLSKYQGSSHVKAYPSQFTHFSLSRTGKESYTSGYETKFIFSESSSTINNHDEKTMLYLSLSTTSTPCCLTVHILVRTPGFKSQLHHFLAV